MRCKSILCLNLPKFKKLKIQNLKIQSQLLGIGLILLFVFACKESSSKQEESKLDPTTEEFKVKDFDFPASGVALSDDAKEAVSEWELYQAMASEIERMQKFKLEDFIANSSVIYNAADTLQKTLPQKLRNRPVLSRLKVLHSKTAQLKQLAERQQPDYQEIEKAAKEVPIDFYNLNIQLNEIFLDLPPIQD